jgi:hypothetical protein
MAPPIKRDLIVAAIKAAGDEGTTIKEIQAGTGVSITCVQDWVIILKAESALHIAGRTTAGERFGARFAFGPGEDAPPIAPKTKAHYSKTYRKRLKKFEKPFVEARALSVKMAERTIESGKDQVIGDLMAGLFGRKLFGAEA